MKKIVSIENWVVKDLVGSSSYTVMDVGLSTPMSLKEYILNLDGVLAPPINDISFMPGPKPDKDATGSETDT